jgi:ABC-type transport system involved in cytochrome c biogenesis permease subunit
MYESLLLISALILVLCLLYRFQKRLGYLPVISFASAFLAFVFLALVSSPLIPSSVHPPVPALQSSWLVLHVSFSFIGEAFFAVAFFASLYYFSVKDPEKKKTADTLTARCISIGYPIFTAGALVFGAVWAQAAWGRYWSWDPKETWALITWLVYTAYLHARYVGKLRGRITAVLSITGFLLALFTFFGVNYLVSGLHSYK